MGKLAVWNESNWRLDVNEETASLLNDGPQSDMKCGGE